MQGKQLEKKKLGRGFWVTLLVMIVLIPLTVGISWYMGDRKYYIASVLIMIYSMLPFFAGFESRKPQARELVTLAVMCAIAVASRAAFIWAPNFKPIGGIVMITAMAFGPQAGFMTGSLSLIVSDMIFGQGPWTPWQMFSFGLLGFISGLLARKGILTEKRPLIDAVIGFLLMVLVVGPILDTCAIFTMAQMINTESVLAVYLAGLPVNISQGTAVFLCVLLLTRPMMNKLERIKIKYGMIEQ
jgi:energy-coupling factor transport system substrate-specific component